MMTSNERAFLDMIAFSEIGPALLAVSDNGYNVIVGSTAENPHLFTDYSNHPHQFIHLGNGIVSTAAGRYQLLGKYFDAYARVLGLRDFSPASQDAIALQQIRECRALPAIETGDFAEAVALCSHIWASLPGSPYGQHTNSLADLEKADEDAGGYVHD